ncbi:MAG: flagellar basal body-associated FliL family protein [Pseudomonadales bacterium]|nr:flagellar basal body-associated FliL family protein [Pseudomonadales bacterium]
MKPLHLAFFFIYMLATSLLHAEDGEEGSSKVQYVPLKPAIVTNYQSKKLSYIKADISLQVTSNATAEAIDRHLPYIRHNLVMLFSRQEEATLASAEGKSRLKEDALAAVISVLDSENESTDIEAILFTSFIVE